jgi:hypothetical protein
MQSVQDSLCADVVDDLVIRILEKLNATLIPGRANETSPRKPPLLGQRAVIS